jgi:ATP-dependent DNA helicase DinG
VEVSAGRLLSVLHRLGPSSRPRHGGGIVAALLREASSCTAFRSEKRREDTVASLRALLAALRECEPLAERCFESMAALLPDDPDRTSLHVNAATKAREAWLPVEAATRNLDAALEKLPRALDAAARPLLELEVPPTSPLPDLLQDLAAAAGALEGFRADLAFVLAAGDEAYVFWIEPADRAATTARAMAAPIEVGPRLADALYSKKRGVIFCSATLTAGGRFDYFRQRLGLDRLEPDAVRELNVGTPFDYRRQCAVLVPSFLPEPVAKGGDYTGAVCRLLADTFERTRGRALVLFTSYRMLREVHGQLEPLLRPLGIDVLAQSISGSRERILERFAHDVESVLLGTHSFWEGVDVPGESLSCVVVARLPFAVLTDPVFEARCKRIEEQGGNAFADFSVPAAVVRFRQGFGRLIRHRTDCGLVLVTDKRIVTRRYGTWFRRSLPVPVTTVDTPEQFGERVGTFVDAMQSGVFSS